MHQQMVYHEGYMATYADDMASALRQRQYQYSREMEPQNEVEDNLPLE